MNKRDYYKLNRAKLKASRGTEDVAGRRLPDDVYGLILRATSKARPFKPRTSKSTLREHADNAWLQWNARSTIVSSSM